MTSIPTLRAVVATHNAHKVAELQRILGTALPGLELVAYDGPSTVEDGDSFAANALIKARAAAYTQLEACIMEHHPYELAEIIALPIAAGSSAYLDWIEHDRKP